MQAFGELHIYLKDNKNTKIGWNVSTYLEDNPNLACKPYIRDVRTPLGNKIISFIVYCRFDKIGRSNSPTYVESGRLELCVVFGGPFCCEVRSPCCCCVVRRMFGVPKRDDDVSTRRKKEGWVVDGFVCERMGVCERIGCKRAGWTWRKGYCDSVENG